jgi:hypothetical protein
MSKEKTIEKPIKKHWYKSAWFPWLIIIVVSWTAFVFIASYFYTMSITQQHSAQVVREASSIVKTLK